VEEVELIETEQPILRKYLGVLAALMAHRGTALYVGSVLDQADDPDGVHRELSSVVRIPVATPQAATMFLMNLPTWGNDPFVADQFGPTLVSSVETGLRELAAADPRRVDIVWGMRQIVYRKGA
jgi:hypothetical protein